MRTIISVFLLLSTYCLCFSQRLTEKEYSRLSDIFAYDVQLSQNVKDTYLSHRKKTAATYTYSTVLELPMNSSIVNRIDKILVIVNSSIYSQSSEKIKRYCYDINYIYGCKVIMKQVSNPNHINIKNLILSEVTNLDGVVLIGDIPVAWYQVSNDHNKYGYAEWPCDLYYMDTDGSWIDSDNDGIFDLHSGNVQPEIFVGRISTANMGTLISEKKGLENYLDKNHKFWIGQLQVNRKYGVSYTDKDWAKTNYFKTDIKNIYGNSLYDSISYVGYSAFGKADYMSRLSNNRYEFIQLACHSSYEHHAFSNGNTIYAEEIFNNGTEAIGYNLFCCSALRWTSVSSSSTRGFLGGAYIYNNNTSGLVAVGSTKTGSMLLFDKFYTALGNGKTFGEALIDWWIDVYGASHSNHVIYWHYGLSIIGDPLVNLYHCMNSRCNYQITLNSFDNSNPSPIRYYLAKDKITINSGVNFKIPSGKHVIFNAPNVDIIKNFECELGGSYEIINEGCKSNCP